MNNLSQLKRLVFSALIIAGLVYLFSISYRVTKLDFVRLVQDAYKAKDFVGAFLQPDLFTRDTETTTITTTFPIPCDSAPVVEQASSGPRLVTSVPCAAVKEKFTLEGYELAPNSDIAVRWHFPDERS